MSITIDLCEFKTMNGSTYGIKVYDDYDKGYDNLMEKKQFTKLQNAIKKNKKKGDLNVLVYANDCGDEKIDEMLKSVKEDQNGITINGDYYDWDELPF